MNTRRLLYGCTALLFILLAAQIAAGHLLLSRWRSQNLAEAAEAVRDIASYSAAALDRSLTQTDALLKALPILLRDQIQEGEIAPAAIALLQAQIGQNEALRNVMIIDEAGEPRASTLSGAQRPTSDMLQEMRSRERADLIVSAPVYDPTLAEWTILLSRRIDLPDLGAVHGVAALSLPAPGDPDGAGGDAARRFPDRGRQGPGQFVQNLRRMNEIADGAAPNVDPDLATLTETAKLSLAPLTLRVVLAPDIALEEWRRDAAWIIALSGVICLLEIIAGVIALAFIIARSRSKREKERATQELSASRRSAQAAADARGIFIANMNHELRTPLNAVIGFSEILTNELFGPIGNSRYRDYAADIHASGRASPVPLSTTSSISPRSIWATGSLNSSRSPLPNALQEAMRLIRPQAAARSLRIEITDVRPDDLGPGRRAGPAPSAGQHPLQRHQVQPAGGSDSDRSRVSDRIQRVGDLDHRSRPWHFRR